MGPILGGFPLTTDFNPFTYDDGNAETLSRELKEENYFAMLYGLDEESIKLMITTGNFRQIIPGVMGRFPKILKKYIPKYVSSFLNTPNMDTGKLVIGLNDYGMVTGVIIDKTTTPDSIKQIIIEILEDEIVNYNSGEAINYNIDKQRIEKKIEDLRNIINMIEVRIHDVETCDHYMDDNSDEIFEKLQNELVDHLARDRIYNKEMVKHINGVERYKQSIVATLNDPTIIWEIIEFICSHVPDDHSGDLESVREDVILQLHGHMNGYNHITYERGQFSDEKHNYHNVTYWIARYRDYMINDLMKIKPKKKNFGPKPKPYRDSMIGNTVQKLVKYHGDEFRICVVEIDIPAGNVLKQYFDDGTKIYYNYNGTPRATKRMIKDDGEPCCM